MLTLASSENRAFEGHLTTNQRQSHVITVKVCSDICHIEVSLEGDN